MKKNYFLRAIMLALSCVLVNVSFAQPGAMGKRVCPTMDLHEAKMTQDPAYRKHYQARKTRAARLLANPAFRNKSLSCNDPLVVPIAVHFQEATNVDVECLRALAADQVRILNEDFQGTNADVSSWTDGTAASFPGVKNGEFCVEFVLGSRNHPDGYGLVDGDPAVTINQTSGEDEADWVNYFNVYVRNIGALGFSPLGGEGNGDGVVIDNAAFASGAGCSGFEPASPYNLGRTLTHELGHYLDLPHIWGGGCGSDDGIADTPDAADSYGGCPDINSFSCGSRDLHMNYMDYTQDACMYMFTEGQANVMSAYLEANLPNVIANADNVVGEAAARIQFALSSITVPEGTSSCEDSGVREITISLTVSEAPDVATSVNVSVAGTGTEGVDYRLNPTMAEFPAGSTNDQTVTLEIIEDGLIEANESIELTFSIEANGGNAVSGNHESLSILLENDDYLPEEVPNVKLINQDFNDGMGNWTAIDGGSNDETWKLSLASGGLNGTQYIISDSDAAGSGSETDEQLLSPVFDGASLTDLRLTFDQYIRVYDQGGNELFMLEVWDGNSWQTLFEHKESSGSLGDFGAPDQRSFDLSNYAANDNQLRFTYRAAYDWYWIVDDVVVSGTRAASVQTEINSDAGSAELNFGPEENLYFYDEENGRIMLRISNLSGHDFGCTRVEVDRAVADAPGGFISNTSVQRLLSDKTFRVIPDNNSQTGNYSISLYYSREEIDGWLAASGETVDDLKVVKADGVIADATELEVATPTVEFFGEDYVFTAVFTSGFSGFALSGSELVLPVEFSGIAATAFEKMIAVDWSTATEVNNYGFDVLRKADTEGAFQKIGFQPGLGEADGSMNYRYIDETALAGIRYFYQLRQLDFDGAQTTSDVVSARIDDGQSGMTIAPNPVSNLLKINVLGADAGAMVLFDSRGRVIRSASLPAGLTQHTLNVEDLPSGVYFLVFTSGSERIVERLVKR